MLFNPRECLFVVNKSKKFVSDSRKNHLYLNHQFKIHFIMFSFEQYLGFIAIMTVVTMGFWLMIFLMGILPYWIGGSLHENWKNKREEKKNKQLNK